MVKMDQILSLDEKKEYCKKLASNLNVLRAKLNLTQAALSERIGISRSMLARIETGSKEMSWITFVASMMFFLNNEETAPIFNALGIMDERLEKFLLLENENGK